MEALLNCFKSPNKPSHPNTFDWHKGHPWSDPRKVPGYFPMLLFAAARASFPVAPVSPQLCLYLRKICASVKTHFWNIPYMCVILWLISLTFSPSSSLPVALMDHKTGACLDYLLKTSRSPTLYQSSWCFSSHPKHNWSLPGYSRFSFDLPSTCYNMTFVMAGNFKW